MKKERGNIDGWCKDRINGYPAWMLRPISHIRGMRDCVRDWYGGYMFGWEDFREFLLDSTKPCYDGLRVFDPDGEISVNLPTDDDISGGYIDWRTRLYVKHYGIYLCSDGRLRYFRDDVIEQIVDKEARAAEDEWWSNFDEQMRSMGYRYIDEEGGYWYNPETGDKTCY